ncbi:hypothetical protein HER10_EVM0002424 [Colletotrichum scovillei]|uniref:uncharacterized protein n=1 Tax=Colletotrichum scovillei TaxID=1209932 RepID=UPI0015C32A64|nr:uncharacterized protein HER10_EVM0002424 [Colletotrichum scovillei]KAF4782741.1 hypothetical protein HER10_EVM0002424 [Colletotrichum scovillei]
MDDCRGKSLLAEMIKQYFAQVHLLTKDVYIWWFRHNIWVIIPEDSRLGYAMTVHTDLVRECATMSRVFCQIMHGWDRDRGSGWTGHTVDYMAARVREATRPVEEEDQAMDGASSNTLSVDDTSGNPSNNDEFPGIDSSSEDPSSDDLASG